MFPEIAQNFFTTGKIQSLELLKAENEFLNDSIRISTQEKSYYYYIGDLTELSLYLDSALRKVFGDEVVRDREWLYEYLNISEKLINRTAIVYKDPARRTLLNEDGEESEEWTEYYNRILPDNINSKNKKAHRFAKLFNTSLTQITFDKKIGKTNHLIEPSCNYKVKEDDNDYLKAKKIGYQKEIINAKGEREVVTIVWTDTEHYMIDSDGRQQIVGDNKDKKNPFGILPFPILRLNEGDNFWGVGAEDTTNVNEIVNFLLTFLLNDNIILGTGGIPMLVNTGISKQSEKKNEEKKPRIGRRHPIVVEDAMSTDRIPPSVSFVSTNPLITEIQNSIDYRIKMIAVSKGLNPNTILSEIKDTSDYQKMMDAVEQLEVRRDDIEPCRDYERQVYEITKIINNKAYEDAELRNRFGLKIIPDNLQLKVDFADIKIELTPEQKWADRKEREARNMASAIDWLMEENPDLTVEQAEEILLKNKEINQGAGSQRQPSFLESLNLVEPNKTIEGG